MITNLEEASLAYNSLIFRLKGVILALMTVIGTTTSTQILTIG